MPARRATASILVAPKPSSRKSAVATSRIRSESCADSRRDGRPPWPRGRTGAPLSPSADTARVAPLTDRAQNIIALIERSIPVPRPARKRRFYGRATSDVEEGGFVLALEDDVEMVERRADALGAAGQ